MMGKNRGKILRPKYNKAGESNIPEGLHNSRPRSSLEEGGYDDNAPITLTPVVVPRRVGGDLSFIRFGDTIEDSGVAVIFECKYNFNIAEYPPIPPKRPLPSPLYTYSTFLYGSM